MKPTVILTHPFIPEVIDSELRPHARVILVKTRAELLRRIGEADGLIPRVSDPVNEQLLAKATRLRAVANFGVGVDNIDFEACARRGIRVSNTPDVLTRSCAELTLALLLAAARRFPEGERLCREGLFARAGGWAPDMLLGQELRGRTAVLVGRGRIGAETGRLFRALGLEVNWITRETPKTQAQALLRKAQVLSLHVPLTPGTRHWLDARKLALLPRDAIVLNTTRGPVVDEKALTKALKTGRIFAAGLDVYEREPEIPLTLRKLPNVVLLPHLGSATTRARTGMCRLAVSGVLGILGGKQPPNEVKSRR